MRKIYLSLLCLSLTVNHCLGQTYRIDTSEISFENKLRPCYSVQYDADARTVKKGWDDYLKKNYKIKVKGVGLFADKDIITGEDVTIGSISDKRMNIYARITDHAGGSEMKYFMSFGYDFFIGPGEYPAEFSGMKKLLNDFSIEFLNKYYDDEASASLKEIKRLERSIKKKNKEIDKNQKKARKGSSASASGLEAKNNSLKLEISRADDKIREIQQQLEIIKEKQAGIKEN